MSHAAAGRNEVVARGELLDVARSPLAGLARALLLGCNIAASASAP